MKKSIDRNLMINISAGIVAGFTFHFFSDVSRNIVEEKEDIFVTSENKNDYISDMIGGVVAGITLDKFGIFQSLFLLLVTNNVVRIALNELEDKPVPSEQDFMRRLIQDLLFLYLLRLIFIYYEKDKNKPDCKKQNVTLSSRLSELLLPTFLINVYLAIAPILKRILYNESEEEAELEE